MRLRHAPPVRFGTVLLRRGWTGCIGGGFEPIEPYPESEIPEDLRAWWVFMERPVARGPHGHGSES
jgi:hypothetical protein